MLRFLQKRKFRLVTRWKLALKDNIARVPAPHPFPFTLIFRAFDEVVHLLRQDGAPASRDAAETCLTGCNTETLPTADQYMELFLSGRDVLSDFLAHDPSFVVLFDAAARAELRTACEGAFRQLIEREMHDYARRHHPLSASR